MDPELNKKALKAKLKRGRWSGFAWRKIWGQSWGDFFKSANRRHLLYIIYAIGMGAISLGPLYLFPPNTVLMRNTNFQSQYAIETGLNFGLVFYLLDNWFLRLGGAWGSFERRTLGKFLISAGMAFLVGSVLQRTVVYDRIDIYYPRLLLFYETYPNARPGILQSVWFFGRAWLVLVLGLSTWVGWWQSRRRSSGSDQALGDKVEKLPQQGMAETASPLPVEEPLLEFNTPEGKRSLDPSEITHATVEDHYCRIHLRDAKAGDGLYIKMPLKELMASLPPERFVQIHRSHLVNLDHVHRAEKKGRSYRLWVGPNELSLPVSRHRLLDIKPRLKQFI